MLATIMQGKSDLQFYCSHKTCTKIIIKNTCIVHDWYSLIKKQITYLLNDASLSKCVMSAHKCFYKCPPSQSGCYCLGSHRTKTVHMHWPAGRSTTSHCILYRALGPIPAHSLHLENNNKTFQLLQIRFQPELNMNAQKVTEFFQGLWFCICRI